MILLRVENISKSFGGVRAASDVSFEVGAGEMVAMIGPNGAGKSTTFNMVGGQLKPDSGRVLLDGDDIAGLPSREILRRGVGRTFQIAQAFLSMTVIENVQMAILARRNEVFGLWRSARALYRDEAAKLLDMVRMGDQAERLVAHLAYSDIKRVEFALALAAEPKLLLMDEPTAGMAIPERQQLMRLVESVATERRIGVLFTEHDMASVFAHADKVLVLARGEMIARGAPEEVRANARVREVYLGRSGHRQAAAKDFAA